MEISHIDFWSTVNPIWHGISVGSGWLHQRSVAAKLRPGTADH